MCKALIVCCTGVEKWARNDTFDSPHTGEASYLRKLSLVPEGSVRLTRSSK